MTVGEWEQKEKPMEKIGLWGTKPLKGTNEIHNGHNKRLENCKLLWPVDDPGNYRSMSLVSHIGKLFTSTINTRLMKWSEDNSVLTDAQFGYRPGYGTHDAISALHSIISKSLRQGKRLYCCFIDYVKAFDSVSHFKLWLKLAKCGVTGKLLNLIKSMYSRLKSSVEHGGNFSEFFIGLV